MVNHLERPALFDDTSVKINMAKTTGWSITRRLDIGALRHDRLDRPWIIAGAINSKVAATV